MPCGCKSSHVRLATTLKNREILVNAISSLESEGIYAEEDGEKVFVRHRTMEGYRHRNMYFIFNAVTGAYDIVGDKYGVGVKFDTLLNKVQVAYKGQAAKRVMTRMGYIPIAYKHSVQENKVSMMARHW